MLKEKEEVNRALAKAKAKAKAKDSIPKHIDYKNELIKITDALRMLKDENIDAKTKNQYLKDIIEKIKYERGEIVRISKENAKLYETDTSKGLQCRIPPYKIRIKLKRD